MKNTKKPASSSKTKKRDSSPSAQSDMKRAETRVEIKPAKGRPMLTWVGKKPLRHAIAYPAQLVESFNAGAKAKKTETWADWSKDLPQTGLLFHGDNKDVLAYLLANGFRGKDEVRMITEHWLEEYNTIRPHEALQGLSPG